MMQLILLLDSPQDSDRILFGRLAYHHRLETPFKSGVLLNIFLILFERRRTDRAEFSASQSRLQHIRSIKRAFGRPRSDQCVQLIDKQDEVIGRTFDLLQNRLETLLELTTKLRPCQKRPEIERDDFFPLQTLRHITGDDTLRQSLGDRRLSRARFPDQDRIVLRPTRQDLHDSPYLLVPTDDRIEFLFPRLFRQIHRVLLKRLIRLLRFLTLDPLIPANLLEHSQNRIIGDFHPFERSPYPARYEQDGKKEVFRRNERITDLLHLLLRFPEHLRKIRRQIQLPDRARFGPRKRIDFTQNTSAYRINIDTELPDDHRNDGILLHQERVHQMRDFHLRIIAR